MKWSKLAFIAAASAAIGCGGLLGDPKEQQVKEGVEWARRTIARTQRDFIAAVSLGSTMEGGGTIVTYLAANMPDGAEFTCYEAGAPTKPYCVYIKQGASDNEFVIEGYGRSLDHPIAAETVGAGLQKRPGGGEPAQQSAAPQTAEESGGRSRAQDAAVIQAVHAQWIISDSKLKAEIILSGQNLAANATVSSSSPQLTVEKIEPDPVRTGVIAVMDPAAAPGDYDLRYEAPGQPPIPFKIHYKGAR